MLLFSASANAETYNFFEITQGAKFSSSVSGRPNWNGDFPTRFAIGYHSDLSRSWYFRYEIFSHISNIDKGQGENWLEWTNITIGYKF